MMPELLPLYNTMKLNSNLFASCVEDLNSEQSAARLNENTNSIIFLLCHILGARYYLSNYLGSDAMFPYDETFGKYDSISQIKEYPAISEVKKYWIEISEMLEDQLINMSDISLLKKSKFEFPIDDDTILGGITFLIHHESYHIGQIGFCRKYLGLTPVSY